MPRPKRPLSPTYGKLKVLRELPASTVEVACECGARKVVSRSNLRAGRILSCGASSCRPHLRAPDGSSLRGLCPTGPVWVRLENVGDVWDLYTAGTEVDAIADRYGVHPQTVYTLLAKIRRLGGVSAYVERVRTVNEYRGARLPAARRDALQERPTVLPRALPGVVLPPPAVYVAPSPLAVVAGSGGTLPPLPTLPHEDALMDATKLSKPLTTAPSPRDKLDDQHRKAVDTDMVTVRPTYTTGSAAKPSPYGAAK